MTRKIVVVLAKLVICCEIEPMSCQLYCSYYSILDGIPLHDRNALACFKAIIPYAENIELNSEASLFPAKYMMFGVFALCTGRLHNQY